MKFGFVFAFLKAMERYGIRFSSAAIEKADAAQPDTILVRIMELKTLGCEVIFIIPF